MIQIDLVYCPLLPNQVLNKYMRKSLHFSFVLAIIGVSSLATVSAVPLPASAYEVYLNGRQGGDPSGYLYNVTLDSNDISRTLDPVKWDVPAGITNASGQTTPIALSATSQIIVKEFTSTYLKLGITLTNTTKLDPNNSNSKASILSFGFGIDPNVSSVQLSQDNNVIFNQATVQSGAQNFPGGFKNIDICIFSANNCSGGNVNQGLQAGQSDVFDLIVTGNFWNASKGQQFVTLSDFPLKFQTNNGSFEAAGVPEPMTVMGSAMALSFGAMFRKKLVNKQKKSAIKQ